MAIFRPFLIVFFLAPELTPQDVGPPDPPPPGGQGVPPWAGGGLPGLKKKKCVPAPHQFRILYVTGVVRFVRRRGFVAGASGTVGLAAPAASPPPSPTAAASTSPSPLPSTAGVSGFGAIGWWCHSPPRALKSHISLKLKLLYSPMRSITMTTLSPK